MNTSDLLRLSKLLNNEPEGESSSSEDDLPRTGYAAMGPGDVGKRTKIKIRGNEADPPKKEVPEDPKAIWMLSEVAEVPASDDALWDPRDQPTYEIKYKQALKTEDIFLQMTNKNPTTACCECLLITVHMDGENKNEVDCNVTKTNLDIRSPKYRLNLPLPHPVDPDTAAAEWESASSRLIITLTMNRELDFINLQ